MSKQKKQHNFTRSVYCKDFGTQNSINQVYFTKFITSLPCLYSCAIRFLFVYKFTKTPFFETGLLAFELKSSCSEVVGHDTSEGMLQVMQAPIENTPKKTKFPFFWRDQHKVISKKTDFRYLKRQDGGGTEL